MKPIFFSTAAEFRLWLEEHHASTPELLLGFHKVATGRSGFRYEDALHQALSFGWIDGVRKSLDDDRFTIRFTPRKPKSHWSRVNVDKAKALIKSGLMHPAGLAAFAARSAENSRGYSYESRPANLPPAYATPFRVHVRALAFFQSQAPWYRRTATWWVISAKKEDTRQKRLSTLIDDSARGRLIGQLERTGRMPRAKA